MACIFKQMPRHYKLQQRITELNSMWNIFPTPNGIIRIQQSLKEKLKARVEKLEQDTPDDSPFKTLKKIRIKLSVDSSNIGKQLQVENFTYALLDKGDSACSYEGCHLLAMYRAPKISESSIGRQRKSQNSKRSKLKQISTLLNTISGWLEVSRSSYWYCI